MCIIFLYPFLFLFVEIFTSGIGQDTMLDLSAFLPIVEHTKSGSRLVSVLINGIFGKSQQFSIIKQFPKIAADL